MREIPGLAYRYLREHVLRSTYLVGVLILAFLTYTLLVALASPFLTPKSSGDNGVSIKAAYGSLPSRYASSILHLPGVKAVAYGTTLPVRCREDVTASINGMASHGVSPLDLLKLKSLSLAQRRAWMKNRRGILVGQALAQRCGWRQGALLQLKTPSGRAFPVRIVALYHNTKQPLLDQVALAHYRYLDSLQSKASRGTVMWMSAKPDDPRAAQRLAVAIDAHFARASPPTESSADTTNQGALSRFGDVLKIVEFVMAAVFACALLVTVNVAAHAAAERQAQFALLRVLGFSRPWLVVLVMAELFYVATIGCGLGLALGVALQRWVARPLLGSLFSGLFAAPASALALAPALAAGIVLISALIPVWEIVRVRTARLTAP